jgi:hypothetical protein
VDPVPIVAASPGKIEPAAAVESSALNVVVEPAVVPFAAKPKRQRARKLPSNLQKKLRILVGIPSLNHLDRYHSYLGSVLSHVESALVGVEHDVFVTPPASLGPWAGLVECQNLIVERFLAGGYDYLWIVELDVQVPLDSFKNLLDLDVDITCGYVKRHNGEGLILGFLDENMRVWYLPLNAVQGNVLSGWVMAGTSS